MAKRCCGRALTPARAACGPVCYVGVYTLTYTRISQGEERIPDLSQLPAPAQVRRKRVCSHFTLPKRKLVCVSSRRTLCFDPTNIPHPTSTNVIQRQPTSSNVIQAPSDLVEAAVEAPEAAALAWVQKGDDLFNRALQVLGLSDGRLVVWSFGW